MAFLQISDYFETLNNLDGGDLLSQPEWVELDEYRQRVQSLPEITDYVKSRAYSTL